MKLAIFDFDDTFVRGDSFKSFCWFALRRNGIRLHRLWLFGFDALMYLVGCLDAGSFKGSCVKIFLVHNDKATLKALANEFVDRVLRKKVYSTALDRLCWHKQQNHTVVFLSASPDVYLTELQSRFGVDRLICTKFISRDGEFTGEIYSANCKGEEKRRRLMAEYSAGEIDWDQSYGYGNSVEDVPFLEILGNPVAVNPDLKLRKIALQRNWLIEIWR